MTEIRNCSRADIADVAALFQKTFRNPASPTPHSLEAQFVEAFLDHPEYDPEIASRVHVNDAGRVTGFIGVFPMRLEHRGRQLRAAVAGTLMVEHPEREPLAGAKLLRSVIKGPQDISISETANIVSQRLWEPLGAEVIPLMSLDWFRPMQPGAAAVAMLAERYPRGGLLTPAAGAVDWLAGRWVRRALATPNPPARRALKGEPSDCEFAAAAMQLSASFELRPAWSETTLRWLLRQARQKARYGEMHRSIVQSRKGELLGCYVYHGSRGGIGRVLQILARPKNVGDVVDCLLREADAAGLAGLRGRCAPKLIDALLTRNCVFLHRASTVIHTVHSEVAEAIRRGEALITGLAGESWTRLVGDEFN